VAGKFILKLKKKKKSGREVLWKDSTARSPISFSAKKLTNTQKHFIILLELFQHARWKPA
jgi:hypothetical protein